MINKVRELGKWFTAWRARRAANRTTFAETIAAAKVSAGIHARGKHRRPGWVAQRVVGTASQGRAPRASRSSGVATARPSGGRGPSSRGEKVGADTGRPAGAHRPSTIARNARNRADIISARRARDILTTSMANLATYGATTAPGEHTLWERLRTNDGTKVSTT
jgi:hypothetical protein